MNEEALALLRDSGCDIGADRIVRIPPDLVKSAVDAAPRVFTVYDQLGETAMHVGSRDSYFGPGPSTPYVVDWMTGERRKAVTSDVANAAKVIDSLKNIDFAMSMALVSDCADGLAADIAETGAMLGNTAKPFISWSFSKDNLESIHKMCIEKSQGQCTLRPFMLTYAEPVSPLTHPDESVKKALFAAEKGIPVIYAPGSVAGGSSPVTVAGNVVQKVAEVLSGIVLIQLKRKGAPCVFGAGITRLDMKTMTSSYVTPEGMLAQLCYYDMARYYGLPSWGFAGCTDAKTLDLQAAAEASLWIMTSMLGGGNLVHDLGYMESGMASSLEMLVFLDEVIGFCRRLAQGIKTDDDDLAVPVIQNVGPGGHFLREAHTLEHCRKAWLPVLFDHSNYDKWTATGMNDTRARVRARIRAILEC